MIRNLPPLMLLLCTALVSGSGCAMCAAPDDMNYAAYGGSWQRDDMAFGRVGSVLDGGGVRQVDYTGGEPPMGESVLADEADDARQQADEGEGFGQAEDLPPPAEVEPVQPDAAQPGAAQPEAADEPQQRMPPGGSFEPAQPLPSPNFPTNPAEPEPPRRELPAPDATEPGLSEPGLSEPGAGPYPSASEFPNIGGNR